MRAHLISEGLAAVIRYMVFILEAMEVREKIGVF